MALINVRERATGHSAAVAVSPGAPSGTVLAGRGGLVRRDWRARYVRRLIVLDGLSGLSAVMTSYALWVGAGDAVVGRPVLPLLILAIPAVWAAAMTAARLYERRFLFVGVEEYRRVLCAAALLLVTVGTVSWVFDLAVARGFVVTALSLATTLTLVHRGAQRAFVRAQRIRGRMQEGVVLVGHPSGVAVLRRQMESSRYRDYRVIGCCLPTARAGQWNVFDGMPVLGDLTRVADVVKRYDADCVAVLPCPELEGPELRRLGWALEETRAELLLAPAITEIAGPRISIRPLSGLPLLHMERPEFTGVRRVVKGVFDRTFAGIGLLILAPLLTTLALAVTINSRGPVLFRHERIGKDGQPFSMLKFRTMLVGADKLERHLFHQNQGNAVQFKMRRDPRVTTVGAFMRRYSLDELPQLFNVLTGSMSLVGPRPHVTREVLEYGEDMRRRLLVKPGITGLWQVSGRSDLSWEDSVRADLRYVENWSLTFDLKILWKTVGAVFAASGAY